MKRYWMRVIGFCVGLSICLISLSSCDGEDFLRWWNFSKDLDASEEEAGRKLDPGLQFELNDEETGYTVKGYDGRAAYLWIPAVYNGLPVTEIGDGAFAYCTGFTSATIPTSVTKIGDAAFRGCNRLESLTLAGSVTHIGARAFASCTGLTQVTLPDSVTDLGGYAFEKCENLSSVSVGEGLTRIGVSIFRDCSALTLPSCDGVSYFGNEEKPYLYAYGVASKVPDKLTLPAMTRGICPNALAYHKDLVQVVIPDHVKTIGGCAFTNCRSLTEVVIGKGLEHMGEAVFTGCDALTELSISSENQVYHASGACLIETASRTLVAACENSVIPDDGSVTALAECVFMGCYMTDFVVPDCVQKIGANAFQGCRQLRSIQLPASLEIIESGTFYNCKALKSVVIPKTVKTVNASAFCGCESLTTVYYEGTEEEWQGILVRNEYGLNGPLVNARRYVYSEAQPTEGGEAWRYVEGIPTVWPSLGKG